jgi:hypothetical protein
VLRRFRTRTVGSVGAGVLGLAVVGGSAAVGITQAVGGSPAPVTSNAALSHHAQPGAVGVAPARSVAAPAALTVPRLRHLTPPDAVVRLASQPTKRQLHRLRHRAGVRAVAPLDHGMLRLGGRALQVVGVPLSVIRGFTPSLTASSTPLWRSIAQGELTAAFARSHQLRRDFGKTVTVRTGRGRTGSLRLGAFATVGLPGADAILSSRAARALGIARDREILVAAPKISLDSLRSDITKTLGRRAKIKITRIVPVDQSVSSSYATQRIPASYLDLYRRAATTCPGLPWTVLAGIGTVETGNGTNVHESTAGAEGPMQFLPSTWARYGTDADGDGKANILDPVDAVFSAARYLCAAGAGLGGQALDDAIFAYNHAWWYVREVIIIANRYA